MERQVRPIWMRERYAGGKGLTFEDTDSAMCKLYTRLAPESAPAATGLPQVLLDPDLRALATSMEEQRLRQLVELWKGRVVQYKSLVRDILSKPQPPLLSNEDEEAARRQEIKEIGASYRKFLLANHDRAEGGWDMEVEPPRSLLIEACLVYKVTYEHEMAKRRGQDKRPTCEGAAHGAASGLAFPWVIATDFLCRAKELKVKQQALGRR